MPDGDIRNFQTEAPARVGEFQDVADAMLRGCQMHPMGFHMLYGGGATCANGAAFFGAGEELGEGPWGNFHVWNTPFGERLCKANEAYEALYGTRIAQDNNERRFTREQIAARIAAL